MKNDEMISICAGCCKFNKENSKTLPFQCPKTTMPCLALKPEYATFNNPDLQDELVNYISLHNSGTEIHEYRLEIDSKFIDKYFIEKMISTWEELAAKGNIAVYTMNAY